MSRKSTKTRNKTITVIAVSLIIILFLSLTAPITQASTPDYDDSWSIPADGSEDSTEYYQIVRQNTSSGASISIKAWSSNTTVLTEFSNIKSVKLFLNATDVSLSDYQSYLSLMGSIDIIVKADTPKINFTFTDIPQFKKAYLDDTEFTDYNYYSDNETLSFTLNMSTHTITLSYGYLGDLITVVLGVSILVFIVKTLKIDGSDF